MTGSGAVDALGRFGLNLLAGYGYNFYREENQFRADDQKIRALVCELLGRAQDVVSGAESRFRRQYIPPPTRTNPFPPADVIADAQRLERLSALIRTVEGQVRHAPVPENDRMTQRFRDERETLLALIDKDDALIWQAETLRAKVSAKTPEELLAVHQEIEADVAVIAETLAERRLMTL